MEVSGGAGVDGASGVVLVRLLLLVLSAVPVLVPLWLSLRRRHRRLYSSNRADGGGGGGRAAGMEAGRVWVFTLTAAAATASRQVANVTTLKRRRRSCCGCG